MYAQIIPKPFKFITRKDFGMKIKHHFPKSYNGEFRQDFVVLDKLPEFLYEKKGVCLIASDDGFYDCLFYDTPGKSAKKSCWKN